MTTTENWPIAAVGDFAHIEHGWPFKSKFASADRINGPVMISVANFNYSGGFRMEHSTLRRYEGEYPSKYELSAGDILLIMTCQTAGGEILGVPGTVPKDGRTYLHNQRLGKLVVDRPEFLVPRYAYHVAKTKEFNAQLCATASGSKILHTSPSRISAVRFLVPPREKQVSISKVLDTLDAKIDTNLSLASIINNLTSAHYAQAQDKDIDTSSSFAQISTVSGGGTPPTSVQEYWNGDMAWATPTDVTALSGPHLERTSRSITPSGLNTCASPLYPVGSILMTSRATIGAFAVIEQPMAVNQGFIVVQPHDERLKWWIFHEMQSRVDEFISHANGAIFLELGRGKFKQLPVRLADEATMHKFNDEAESLHAIARAALRENATLAALRDALLPELMSGRMRVRDAEDQVGEVL